MPERLPTKELFKKTKTHGDKIGVSDSSAAHDSTDSQVDEPNDAAAQSHCRPAAVFVGA